MELKDYTDEQLKAELKRRAAVKREAAANIPRCRNCKHLIVENKNWYTCYKCGARTYIMYKRAHNYIVSLSKRACQLYEKKEE